MHQNLTLSAMDGVDLVAVIYTMRAVVSMDISKTIQTVKSVKQSAYKNPCVLVMLSLLKNIMIQIDVIFTEISRHRKFSQAGNT